MKALVFTTVFPSPDHPLHGLFVAERIRHAARLADVKVVSPIAWLRRRTARAQSRFEALEVEHPAFFTVPGLFKSLDALFLFLSALACVRRLRRRFDFDLIDAHFGYPDGVAAVLLAWWFDRPVVITLRGSELEMARFRLRAAALRWALRRADRVIAVSEPLAALARTLGASPERVRVIGNGVDLDRFRPMPRTAAREELGIDDRATLVVSIGHLAPVKGFDLLLRVIQPLATEQPDLKLVIVGGAAPTSGGYPARLASRIERLGVSRTVSVTGPVDRRQVALWLNAADLFVLASEREGSSNALREAMACGCPAVVSDAGDASVIVGRYAGFIVSDRHDVQEWRRALRAALERDWDRAAIRAGAEAHAWSGKAEQIAREWRGCLTASSGPGYQPCVEKQSGDPV
jgi:glycosyltransferase involved in cell wall biosynthesis